MSQQADDIEALVSRQVDDIEVCKLEPEDYRQPVGDALLVDKPELGHAGQVEDDKLSHDQPVHDDLCNVAQV